jgi:GNAT superfamily N-acetyltransferase
MSETTIRKATPNDFDSLVELYGEMELHVRQLSADPLFTLGSDWRALTKRYFTEFSSRDDNLVLVAVKGTDIVGFLTAMVTTTLPIFEQRNYGLLNDMFVKQEHRGKGVGKRLLVATTEWFEQHRITEWFEQHRIRRLEVRVEASNSEAIAFYKAHAFKIRSHTEKRD